MNTIWRPSAGSKASAGTWPYHSMAALLGKLQPLAGLTFRQFPVQMSARSITCHAKRRKVNVSHIMVDEGNAALLDQAEERLANGATFADVAADISVCKVSAKRGGQIGWLGRGEYFPEFEAVAYAVPVGALARATTPRGHHLLMVTAEREEQGIEQMTVQELAEFLASPGLVEEAQLVDVREQSEADIARLPGFKLYPTSEFQAWRETIAEDLDPEKQTVVLCHHGVRSMNIAAFLALQGFTSVFNVTGGIDAYSRGVDNNVPTY